MPKNKKQTSSNVASEASKILKNPNSSAIKRKLAGSALSQANTGKETGAAMETVASKVLNSPKYSDETKTMAATVLSQSNKKR